MSYQKERDRFLKHAEEAGLSEAAARGLLRDAATLHRLGVAACNGCWPADNGERRVKPCARCGGRWVPSSLNRAGVCQDCAAEDRAKARVKGAVGVTLEIQGDPRGWPLRLRLSDGRELGVPVRG